jgi:hypothetical protein
MASTYTTRIRLEKQADGENPNSWGLIMNQNVIDLIDEAIAGYAVVSVSSVAVSLTNNDGATDEARNAALEIAGTLTADVTITIPSQEKLYFIRDNTAGSFDVNMKTASGSAAVVNGGTNILVACDGTNIHKLESPTSVASFTANTLTATTIGTAVLNVTSNASITTLTNTSITTSIVSATELYVTGIATSTITGTAASFTGTVSAAAFDGDGSNLTGVPAPTSISNTTVYESDGSAVSKNAVQSFAKMWVNFNASAGTARDSFNMGSLDDIGPGLWGINFDSDMSNANYAVVCEAALDTNANPANGVDSDCAAESASRARMGMADTGAVRDKKHAYLVAFGDMA